MESTMQDHIAKYIASGEDNKTAFCKREGIAYHQFKYYWNRLSHETGQKSSSGFATVKVKESVVTKPADGKDKQTVVVRIFSGDQLRLEVQGEFSASFLRELAGC